jgi:hypothetical protein
MGAFYYFIGAMLSLGVIYVLYLAAEHFIKKKSE